MILTQFINDEMRKPFVWGETDCASTVDRWIKLNRGYSVLERAGIHFSNEEEKNKILLQYRGYLRLLLLVAKVNKEQTTDKPELGDIGAIVIRDGRIAAAIYCDGFWFSHDEHGLIGAAVEHTKVLRIWKLNKCLS